MRGDAGARARGRCCDGGQLIRHKIALLRHSASDAGEEEEKEKGRERERGWFCLLARIHIPPRAAAAAGRSRASSRSVLHPKNGLRRNTALEEGTSVACIFGPGITHESPFPLSSNLSNRLSFPAWPVPSLTLCLAAESVVVAEKRNSIFSGRRYAEFC